MTYRWEYLRCQVNSFTHHTTFKDQVVKCSSRTFLTKADCIYNALQQGGQMRLDIQVVLCIIKERDDMLTSPLSNYAARLTTFKTWPPSIPLPTTTMAAAGFFYEGIGDRVTCYSCGKSLKNWKSSDNPWAEHHRHSPICVHLNGPPRQEDVTGPGDNNHCHEPMKGTAEVCDGGDLMLPDDDHENMEIHT